MLRPSEQESGEGPFAARPYFPRYLPAELHRDVGIATYIYEPNSIYLGFARPRNHRSAPGYALEGHAVDTITRFIVHQAGAGISEVGRKVQEIPAFAIAADGSKALKRATPFDPAAERDRLRAADGRQIFDFPDVSVGPEPAPLAEKMR